MDSAIMEDRTYRTDDDLPCAGQTAETIHAWAQKLKIGNRVALRQSSSHIYVEYSLGEVEAFTDQDRRVMVKNIGTFWRTPNAAGKHCFHPTGQLSMLEPTKAVVEAANKSARYRPSSDGA